MIDDIDLEFESWDEYFYNIHDLANSLFENLRTDNNPNRKQPDYMYNAEGNKFFDIDTFFLRLLTEKP